MKEMPISPGQFEAELKARKGTPAQADVERLYAMRAAFVVALQAKGIVDVRDIGELDRLGRCEVASHHWRLCTPEARDALLRDAHHQVRSCALLSQLNEKDAAAAPARVQEDYWYHHRHELEAGMVFVTAGGVVRLDRSVPGDGTKWYVSDFDEGLGWSCYDSTIEPGDLLTMPFEDSPQSIDMAIKCLEAERQGLCAGAAPRQSM